ncbi:MAG: hypothetical protein HYY01_00380 [Chloroflexi bacterium]|nr:hypothetical protein [Chloroflexota bacterium]
MATARQRVGTGRPSVDTILQAAATLAVAAARYELQSYWEGLKGNPPPLDFSWSRHDDVLLSHFDNLFEDLLKAFQYDPETDASYHPTPRP